jgi:hypothetical protein
MGDIDKALEDLNQAIRLNSEVVEAYNNRATVLFAKKCMIKLLMTAKLQLELTLKMLKPITF